MAHSIQVYRGKHEVINDLDLVVIIGLALQIIQQSTQFESLQSLATEWQKALDLYGPGVIDLKINELTHAQVADLRTLLKGAFQQALRYEEKIPAEVLKKMVKVSGVTFNDYRTEWVIEAVKKLQALIAES